MISRGGCLLFKLHIHFYFYVMGRRRRTKIKIIIIAQNTHTTLTHCYVVRRRRSTSIVRRRRSNSAIMASMRALAKSEKVEKYLPKGVSIAKASKAQLEAAFEKHLQRTLGFVLIGTGGLSMLGAGGLLAYVAHKKKKEKEEGKK